MEVQYVHERNLRISIVPFWCRNCGHLELYAMDSETRARFEAQRQQPEKPLELPENPRLSGVVDTMPPPSKRSKKNEETHDVRS